MAGCSHDVEDVNVSIAVQVVVGIISRITFDRPISNSHSENIENINISCARVVSGMKQKKKRGEVFVKD